MAPVSLSSTGGLLMSSAWIPPAPTAGSAQLAAGGASGSRSIVGSAQYHERTVPRLMPTSGGGGATTVDELDQLSALLRQRAEMASKRPNTAGNKKG